METAQFKSLTVLIMASNETNLLRETVSEIHKYCSDEDLDKIIIIAKDDKCPSYFEALKLSDEKAVLHIQQAPNPVLCIAEMASLAESSHFLMMAADMEMDPASIATLIHEAKLHPERIICAAKWNKNSVVEGYNALHSFFSRAMNKAVSIVMNVKADELFSIFQIYPSSVYKKINFGKDEDFLYEYTLKPVRCGVEYEEIPTVYKKRNEGKSNFNIKALSKIAVKFCLTAVKLRLSPKR